MGRHLGGTSIIFMAVLSSLLITCNAFCQSDLPKFELAAQYVLFHCPSFDETDSGLGGRFGYNINQFLSVESEFDLFPQKRPVLNAIHSPILDYNDSRRMEALFGIKAGIRRPRFGVFGKARPGFFYISEGSRFIDPDVKSVRAPEQPRSQFQFAMDWGGAIEAYLSDQTFVRIDVGDTMIKFKRSQWGDTGVRNFLSHNLQMNIGIGYRF